MNDPGLIDDLLSSSRTIAVVGYSPRPDRPSNSVSRTLRGHGYRVIPVNPAFGGAIIEGERSYERLADLAKEDEGAFVEVFCRGEFLAGVVDDQTHAWTVTSC